MDPGYNLLEIEGDNGGWAKPVGNLPALDCNGALPLNPAKGGAEPLLCIKVFDDRELIGGWVEGIMWPCKGGCACDTRREEIRSCQFWWNSGRLAGCGKLGTVGATTGALTDDLDGVFSIWLDISALIMDNTQQKRSNFKGNRCTFVNNSAYSHQSYSYQNFFIIELHLVILGQKNIIWVIIQSASKTSLDINP